MFSKIITLALIATIALSDNHRSIAYFNGSNGINGTVVVDYGSVTVNLDLSGMPDLPNGFENCTENGLKYHIHELWEYGDGTSESLSCGAAVTGGHYDPWQGTFTCFFYNHLSIQ